MNPKRVARKILPQKGIKAAEETYRKSRVYALQARSGFPARKMRVIAVTGTNGKTTTCCFINQVLKAGGFKTALYTTAVVELDSRPILNTTHRTVPLTAQLVNFISQAKDLGVDFLILETTSQALDQHKTLGIPVEIAVMTNLTQDHLDYHGTMEAYAGAKARLFNRYSGPKYCVLNRDDEWFDYFKAASVGEIRSYGRAVESTDQIEAIEQGPDGSRWKLARHGALHKFQNKIPGLFNVYNATAAAVVGDLVGMQPAAIRQGIADLPAVPGRMEIIEAGQNFTVIVDYAHAPDALKRILEAAREMANGKIRLVFGATGDRDRTKRPIMGQIAAEGADMVYLTDDETYNEDPAAIRSAVRQGIEAGEGTFVEIGDRRAAIKQAFADAKQGDVVILAGIGHQDSRNMGGELEPWDEREVARAMLKN